MANQIMRLFKYVDIKGETLYPTSAEVSRADRVAVMNGMEIIKVIKHGYVDKWGDEFIITTYTYDMERV
jgi:hypothetical protein